MTYLSPLGTFLWDNFDLILFGFLALLALEELNSGFSMIELARGHRKRKAKAPSEGPEALMADPAAQTERLRRAI